MGTRIVPDLVQKQELATLGPKASVREAAQIMAKRRIGALLITEKGRLLGIFTERDLAIRVVAAGLDPDATPLDQVMTPDPDTLRPDDEMRSALQKMAQRGYRHLPVVENGKLVAMVSVRDLYASILARMETGIARMADRVLRG